MKKKIKDFKKDSKLDNSLVKEDLNLLLFSKDDKNHTNNNNIINKHDYEILSNNENNKLASPFDAYRNSAKINFDEKEIKKILKEIIHENDHYLICHIIKDKQKHHPNSLKNEIGVFRDTNGDLLQVVYGGEKGFKIPKHIMDIGANEGLSILSHNHLNGVVIPSLKDIKAITSYQSNYSPIYSPNKISLLVNYNVSKNKEIRREISNKYNKFIKNKEIEIQKLYPEKIVNIKSEYTGNELDKKLKDDYYRPYFAKHQENITKEINAMFKENDFALKLYIL